MKIYVITFNGTVIEAHVVYSSGVGRLNALREKDSQPEKFELTSCMLYGES